MSEMAENDNKSEAHVILIEAFYGGSHKQLVDLLVKNISGCVLYTMPAKKWHWRMRTSALYFMQNIPIDQSYRALFCSSVVNLAELMALRKDLSSLKKVLYFHENQLVYPVRKQQDRDFQFGYNQILSSLVADVVLFNSCYNMDSFLNSIDTFLNLMPDFRPKNLSHQIRSKSKVLYFPICLVDELEFFKDQNLVEDVDDVVNDVDHRHRLHIVWPHRWEHDKDPTFFFQTIYQLKDLGFNFNISVIGATFTDVPEIFQKAKEKLADNIIHWGYQESREDYINVLKSAHVAVSTAKHEFFGVAMLEAVCCGCFALCPNSLVYPEIFPEDCLYNTQGQLLKRLKRFAIQPLLARENTLKIDVSRFSWKILRGVFENILLERIPQ
ncbi:glycosyltransferase-like domain-containing protein 1 isoform X2 [Xenia sp. Carnegie-2017]|uniref:glycosyltransferase-like domain-containing protein 1 isoform X2 n=1 Tax=Xenia sp. Carnegie-2017 TaxID=2897299 RepID=UPI001F04E491|nr:glycosyltransferase-like domain-containing protein 1 isoform X2 [Xenia sp. Carnegie-2017]